MTVIVGPNNSGKSLALREIMFWAEGDDRERRVVDEIDVEWPADIDGALKQLRPFEAVPSPGEQQPPNSILLSMHRVDGKRGPVNERAQSESHRSDPFGGVLNGVYCIRG